MFGQQHFYHRIVRKMVVAFGTMFNDITLKRYNKAGTQEIERINVPLMYSQKEKFYQRITQDPELTKETAITLPRMGFELSAITYDPTRKRSLFVDSFSAGGDSTSVKSIRTTPFNFDFTLSIYVRNVEDGTQIVEQILPYFNPDYTMKVDFLGLADQKTDIPFILQSVQQDVEDVGSADPIRIIIWTLTFTAKGYMFGPVINRDVIRKVTANTFNSIFDLENFRTISFANTGGSGNFTTGELVYEGKTLTSSNVTAKVKSWKPDTNTLIITDVSGILKTGRYITGVDSNASYNIASFSTNDFQLNNITVNPNPNTANANSAFGYDTLIEEFPNIV
jgi:hypothetical protein